MSIYPIMLKVRGQLAVIIGGGSVAMRKVRTLKKVGAKIRIISDAFADETDIDDVEVIRESYQAKFLQGADLVFACTNEYALNEQVAADARKLGALVNSVDQPPDCDFYVPAIVTRGDVIVAIGTGGAAPAFAAQLRKQIDEFLPQQIGDFVRSLANMRKQLMVEVDDIHQRGEIMKKLSNPASYEAFCKNGESALTKIYRKFTP